MSIYIEIDSLETFDTVTANSKVCVVDFYTIWCAPCKKLAPLLEKNILENSVLAPLVSTDANNVKDKLVFAKVDVDQFADLATTFKVSSIPMIVFYKNGELQTDTVKGADLNAIVSTVNKLIA